MADVKGFLKKKNVEISAKRYGIDALGAMAQGLFASLLMGTILSTLGNQLGIAILATIGGFLLVTRCSVRRWFFSHWPRSVWQVIRSAEQAVLWLCLL